MISAGYSEAAKANGLQNVKDATYTILTRHGQGSGVVVKSDSDGSLIVTNKHVCHGSRQTSKELKDQKIPVASFVLVFAKPMNKRPIVGQIISVALNSDLCLIHLEAKNLAVVKLAKEPAKPQQKIYTHGSPFGQEGTTEYGEVIGKDYADSMQHTVAKIKVRPGASGSGVFNEDNELVGIVARMASSSRSREPDLGMYVPLSHVRLFLRQFGVLQE